MSRPTSLSLIQAVKEATGRELVIDGPMRLRMFPVPRVSAQRVHFANAPGAKGAQMVDVRWIGASPSWWALLRGNVEIGRLTLYQPTIVLETDADGVPNWQFKPGAGASQAEGAPAEGFHLAIGELRIVQGTLSYTNPRTRQTIKAEQVEATAQVRSLEGPLAISGKATVNGVPLSLDVGMSERKADGHDLAFALQVLSGKLDFKGRISALDASAELKGHLAVTTGVLTDFIAAIVRAGGQASPKFDASVVGRFTFDGGIELTPTRLAVTDFKMTMGAETASGTLAFEQSATPSLKGRVALPKIDLEKWLALLASPGAFQPAQPAGKAPAPPKPASLSPFPTAMDVSLALDVAEVVYRKGTVRDLAVAVEIHKGVITVPQLKAVLPGDMRVQATVQANGELSVTGPRLRETLAWLEVDPSGVPSDKLQRLDLKGKIVATGSSVQIADVVAELDGQRATGSGSVTFATPLAVAATLQADRFDLDGYLPAEPAMAPSAPLTPLVGNAATPSAATAPVAIATLIPAAPAPPDPATPVIALKAKVAKLVFRKQTLGGIEGDASLQGNLLKVNALKIADLLGAKADLKGTVTDFATAPRYDLTFNATLPDADKVLAYAGLPKLLNGKIGAVSANGGVLGTMNALALRNVSATMLGSTARVTGALALGSNFRFDFPTFNLQTQDAGRLVAAASGQPPAAIGAVSAAGAFKGDGQRVAFDGSLTAFGAAMTGHVDATLGERPNINVNLRVPGTLDLDDWLGVSSAPPAAGGAASTPAAGGASAARRDRQADRSRRPARLRRHGEARDQRRRARLDQSGLCRPGGDAARRHMHHLQAHRPVLWRRRRLQRHRRRHQERAGGRSQGQPAGHLFRRDAARHGRHQQLRQRQPDGGGRRQGQRHGHLRARQRPHHRGDPQFAHRPRPGHGLALSHCGQGLAGPGVVRHRRRQHLQHRDGFRLGRAVGLHQPPEQHRGRGHDRQRNGVARQAHGAGPERRGPDHQPHQPGCRHHRHDHRARHRAARAGGLCRDGEGAGVVADHDDAWRSLDRAGER